MLEGSSNFRKRAEVKYQAERQLGAEFPVFMDIELNVENFHL